MQQGLFFLWLLSIAVSAAAWIYVETSLAVRGGFKSRRQLTGCELARQVLDRSHLNQTAVYPLSGNGRVHAGLAFDRLLLAEPVYYGTRLRDFAAALHEAAHLLTESKPLLSALLRNQGRRLFRITLLISWLLILGGVLLPACQWMAPLGQFLFVLMFFSAFTALRAEGEATERALTNLTLLEGFGMDERLQMKRLLEAMRWTPFAELFGEPLNALPRSERVH